MANLLAYSAAGLVLWSLAGWVWQMRTRNGGYADVVWISGLGATGLFYLIAGNGEVWARVIAGGLLLVWSLRLGSHILTRVAGEPEDGRYQAMRERLGTRINLFHLFFFLGQGALAWLFALPHWVIAGYQRVDMPVLFLFGVLVGLTGIIGEAVADRQLARWRRSPDNRGKTCRRGLWRYSRHPNYFCEWLHWLGWPLMAVGAPLGGWVWLAPVLMFLFLWFVTGIPYTEKQALKSRGEDYRHYQRTTPAFFPWRPRDAD